MALYEYHEQHRPRDLDHGQRKSITSKPATKPLSSSVEFVANEKRLQNVTHSTWKLPFKGSALPISKAAIKEEFRRLDIVGENRLTILNLRSALELREVREPDSVIRQWFSEHDRGGKGYIDFKDYQAIYEHASNSNIGYNANGGTKPLGRSISFDDPAHASLEASHLVEHKRVVDERHEILRKAFERYDVDKDGRISSEDLRSAFTAQGKAFTTSDLNTWVQTRDLSGTGAVSFEDFVKHYK